MSNPVEHRSSIYAWLVVVSLLVVWMLNYLDRQIIFSVFPLLRSEYHLSSLQLGLFSTTFLWVYAFFSPIAGYVADQVSRKKMICASLLIWSLATLCTARAGSYSQLLTLRVVLGISEACFLPAALSLVAAYHSTGTRSRAMGLLYTGTYPGLVLGGLLGGALASHFGWRFGFSLFGVAGCGYAVVLVLVLRDKLLQTPYSPESSPERSNVFHATLRVFQTSGFRRNLITFAVASMCDWAVYTWMPLYLYENFHFSLARAGFTATFYMKTGGVVGLLAGGALADALARRAPAIRSSIQTGGLLIAAPCLIVAGFTHAPSMMYAVLLIHGTGKGAYDGSVVPLLCEWLPESLRATAVGLLNAAGAFAGGAIAAAAGAVKQSFGLGQIFAACGLLLAVAGLLSIGNLSTPSIARA